MTSPRSGGQNPARGEVWDVDLNPVIGREQAGRRPVLIVSDDALNLSPRGLVIVLPITASDRGFPSHVLISPPEGGLIKPSVIMTEQGRAIPKERLTRRYGTVSEATMQHVGQLLQMLLGL